MFIKIYSKSIGKENLITAEFLYGKHFFRATSTKTENHALLNLQNKIKNSNLSILNQSIAIMEIKKYKGE